MKSRFILLAMLAMCMAPPSNAQAAAPMVEFADTAGCRVRGSAESIARLKEIAAEGSVTWDGKCTGGYIDGPGVLRHQGLTRTNDRARRYVFYLSGTAKAGVRTGIWLRETFNMFEDSSRYWTSLATITYVDGIAKGSPKLREVRKTTDFSAPFRAFLAETDRRLASQQEKPRASPAPEPAAPAQAAAPAAQPGPATAMPAMPAERPAASKPDAPVSAAVPSRTPARDEPTPGPTTSASATPSPPPAPPPVATSRPLVSSPPVSSPTPPSASAAVPAPSRGNVPPSGFQGSGLRPLEGPGTPLAAAPARPEVIEQGSACSLDEINGKIIRQESIVASAGLPLKISGWAADPRQPRIPEQAWLRMFDRGGGPGLLLDLPRNVNRPDVASALGNALYARAGFEITIEPGRLTPGEYTIAIVQQIGGTMAVCTATGRLSLMAGEVRPAPSPR